MSSNYPDDIRNYDDDPRSPFYDGDADCPECGECMAVESDADEDGIFTIIYCVNIDCPECSDYEEVTNEIF
tara:strand:- start:244 stop:456 length:213 start_codon:yes stop_codon:yes gene_type:complete